MPEDITGKGKFPRAVRELQQAVFAPTAVIRAANTLTDVTTRGVIIRPTAKKTNQGTTSTDTVPRWG